MIHKPNAKGGRWWSKGRACSPVAPTAQVARSGRAFRVLTALTLVFATALSQSLLARPRRRGATRTLTASELRRLFQDPPDDSKIMMRWWWFGPAVTEAELEREMRSMKAGGIGGFEIQPVYPLALDDPATGIKNLPFLSDEFIDRLRFASVKARELGLRVDLTLGSGWPFGGPFVSINEAASKLRVERIALTSAARRAQLPAMSAGENLLGVFLVVLEGERAEPENATEIKPAADGAVLVPAGAERRRELQFFISSRTGMQVKRAALGAEGFVVDHLNRAAVDAYLSKVGDRLMQAFGDRPPRAIFCDSLEAYGSDWTDDFLEEFKRRRGYDLKPHLPSLVGEASPKALAVRHDWAQTLTELLNERFLAPLSRWAARKGTLLRIQDYGVPAAALSSNAYADLPEGEGSQWRTLSASRWASSAGHIFARDVISSETWTWLRSPAFRATPLDMKAEADRQFLQGINQLVGHGWPYSPDSAGYPGWRFYAAGAFNEKNPWWIVMPDVARYLQRVSFMLRQGEPASDVAVYLPNDDAWSRLVLGNTNLIEALRDRIGPDTIPALLDAGHNFDFFDDAAFKQTGRIENGCLRLGKRSYRAVILPSVESIRLETLRAFEKFAREGGALVALDAIPTKAPGFQAADSDGEAVASLARALFEGAGAKGRHVIDATKGLAAALDGRVGPDARFAPAAPEIGFIRRRAADLDIYFIANTGNARRRIDGLFKVTGKRPEWWDPMTGRISPARVGAVTESSITVPLDIEPYGSRLLVFSPDAGSMTRGPEESEGAEYAIDLGADWSVRFAGGEQARQKRVGPWTDDEKALYYSGAATYEKGFTLPPEMSAGAGRIILDFGEAKAASEISPQRANGMSASLEAPVKEAAVVSVNGRRVGSVWCPPYVIDITDYLKPGENLLQVAVANTAINGMAGRAQPDYRLLNLRYGERFQPQDMDKIKPVASGLSGPVRLILRRR